MGQKRTEEFGADQILWISVPFADRSCLKKLKTGWIVKEKRFYFKYFLLVLIEIFHSMFLLLFVVVFFDFPRCFIWSEVCAYVVQRRHQSSSGCWVRVGLAIITSSAWWNVAMVKRWVIIIINPKVWVDFAWIVKRTGKKQKLFITSLLGLSLLGRKWAVGFTSIPRLLKTRKFN